MAAGSKVSEPDEVSVSVGAIASTLPGAASPENLAGPFVESDSLEQVARRALILVHPEPEMVDNLVTTFEDIATRMDLYESYAETVASLPGADSKIRSARTGRIDLGPAQCLRVSPQLGERLDPKPNCVGQVPTAR